MYTKCTVYGLNKYNINAGRIYTLIFLKYAHNDTKAYDVPVKQESYSSQWLVNYFWMLPIYVHTLCYVHACLATVPYT